MKIYSMNLSCMRRHRIRSDLYFFWYQRQTDNTDTECLFLYRVLYKVFSFSEYLNKWQVYDIILMRAPTNKKKRFVVFCSVKKMVCMIKINVSWPKKGDIYIYIYMSVRPILVEIAHRLSYIRFSSYILIPYLTIFQV